MSLDASGGHIDSAATEGGASGAVRAPSAARDQHGASFDSLIMICKALRVWTLARELGEPVQIALYAFLNPKGLGILAPVLDGLFACAETALARSLRSGCGCAMSADESWLCGLIGVTRRDASGWTIRDSDRAALLDGAARSARIMLRMALASADQRH